MGSVESTQQLLPSLSARACCTCYQDSTKGCTIENTAPRLLNVRAESSDESAAVGGMKSEMSERIISMPAYFPVHCLPMAHFKRLTRMQPHEAVLQDLILPEGCMTVHFVSHEWLSFKHPDPNAVQLQHMQSIFQKFIDGHAYCLLRNQWESFLKGVSSSTGSRMRRVEGSMIQRGALEAEDVQRHVAEGCVWLDYHSIPQDTAKASFLDAVHSIPHYVERCNYFWICAPPTRHEELGERRDYYTWKGRGWCRLEDCANLLSKRLKMPLVVTNTSRLDTYGFIDGLHYFFNRPERSVANGNFTCCYFAHKVKQADGSVKEIPCDRDAICPVLVVLFHSLFNCTVAGTGSDMFRRKLLLGAASSIFAGFEEDKDHRETIEQWLPQDSETVEDFLIRAGFDSLDGKDAQGFPVVFWAFVYGSLPMAKRILQMRPELIYKNSSVGLTTMGGIATRPAAEVRELFALLPQAGPEGEKVLAAVNLPSPAGLTTIDRAAKFGFHDTVEYLLEFKAFVEPRRIDNGQTPLQSSASEGYHACCKLLLEHRADVHARDHQEQTALHLAAVPLTTCGNPDGTGKLKTFQILLDAKADPTLVDKNGLTPRDVAAECGFMEVLALLPPPDDGSACSLAAARC